MMGKRHGVFSVIKFCGRIINSAKEHEYGVSFYKIFSSPQSVNHLCMQSPFLVDRSSVDESDTYGDSSVIAKKSEQNNTDASEQERKKKRTAFVFCDFEKMIRLMI